MPNACARRVKQVLVLAHASGIYTLAELVAIWTDLIKIFVHAEAQLCSKVDDVPFTFQSANPVESAKAIAMDGKKVFGAES